MPQSGEAVQQLLRKVRVVNIGLAGFSRDLKRHGTDVVQVDWSPPAGSDVRLIALLDRLNT